MRPFLTIVSMTLTFAALLLSAHDASAQRVPLPFAVATSTAEPAVTKPSRPGISPIRCISSGCAR